MLLVKSCYGDEIKKEETSGAGAVAGAGIAAAGEKCVQIFSDNVRSVTARFENPLLRNLFGVFCVPESQNVMAKRAAHLFH